MDGYNSMSRGQLTADGTGRQQQTHSRSNASQRQGSDLIRGLGRVPSASRGGDPQRGTLNDRTSGTRQGDEFANQMNQLILLQGRSGQTNRGSRQPIQENLPQHFAPSTPGIDTGRAATRQFTNAAGPRNGGQALLRGVTAYSTNNDDFNEPGATAMSNASHSRENISTFAKVPEGAWLNPMVGTFRTVVRGEYGQGPRKGEPMACKTFLPEHAHHEEEFYNFEFKIVDKAIEIVNKFNKLNLPDQAIWVNKPQLWRGVAQEGGPMDMSSVFMCEPFVEGWVKWNSNTGEAKEDDTILNRKMQALSHFSYHITNGQLLLCDVQGDVHPDKIVITDPVIISKATAYGPTDMGPEGIDNFFSNHRCNRFCQDWMTPSNPKNTMAYSSGTVMLWRPGMVTRRQETRRH
jgi:hypothetical protein